MKRPGRVMFAAVAISLILGAPVFAQGTPQTAGVMKVDPASIVTGYRVSKVVGKSGRADHWEMVAQAGTDPAATTSVPSEKG
jgi:hypothetical protein